MQLKYIALLAAFILIIGGLVAYSYTTRATLITISKVSPRQSRDSVPARRPSAHVETID